MKNEMALHQKNEVAQPANSFDWWTAMKEQAQVMLKSGFLPPTVKTAEQCMAIAMTGKELGIGFMESIRSINVIQGKPTISPQLMLALANRTKEIEDIEITVDNNGATVMVKRKGRKAHTEKFGVAEATALQLIGKDNYKKQATTMYKWRAVAANLRITFPDVVLGLYTPEELGVEVVIGEGESMEIPQKQITPSAPLKVHAPAEPDHDAIEPSIVETKITAADWAAIEKLRKSVQMTPEVMSAQLQRMGYSKASDFPAVRLFELRQWIKGELTELK